jgi:hypothetical protein
MPVNLIIKMEVFKSKKNIQCFGISNSPYFRKGSHSHIYEKSNIIGHSRFLRVQDLLTYQMQACLTSELLSPGNPECHNTKRPSAYFYSIIPNSLNLAHMYPLWDKIQSCPTLFVKHVIVSQQATSLLSFQINSMQTSQNKTSELLNMKTRVLLNMKKYYYR